MTILAKLAAVAFSIASMSTYAIPVASTGAGRSVIVANTGNVFATYMGSYAHYTDVLYLGDVLLFNNHTTPIGRVIDLGSFAAGTELIFRLGVTNTGIDFFTGDGSRNPDAKAHARVQSDYLVSGTSLVSFEDMVRGDFDFNDFNFTFTNTFAADTRNSVPEPGSLALLAVGLVGMAAIRKRPSS